MIGIELSIDMEPIRKGPVVMEKRMKRSAKKGGGVSPGKKGYKLL
jgi:hypothetical protein